MQGYSCGNPKNSAVNTRESCTAHVRNQSNMKGILGDPFYITLFGTVVVSGTMQVGGTSLCFVKLEEVILVVKM